MSSVVPKSMKCYHCLRTVSIQEENFPENLHDLIQFYNVDQLLWVCKRCKNITDLKSPVSEGQQRIEQRLVVLEEGQQVIDRQLIVLTENVRRLTNEVKILTNTHTDIRRFSFDVGDKLNISETSNSSAFGSDSYCRRFSPSPPREDSYSDSFEKSRFSPSPPLSDTCIKAKLPGTLKRQSPSYPRSRSSSPAGIQYVEFILNKIKIPKDEDTCSRKIVNDVLNMFLESLKENPEFKCLYNKPYYTGSSYNDLRISSASEFDINLVLRICKNQIFLKPEFFDQDFTFGKLKILWQNVKVEQTPEVFKFLSFCQKDDYLIPEQVLSWFQRHVETTLRKPLVYPDRVLKIKSHKSGPAQTLVIETALDYSISLDLVPVFEFVFSDLMDTPFEKALLEISEDKTNHTWFMVPKGCQGECDLKMSEVKYSWRLDFPNAEKLLLRDKQCVKNVIKLLKLFRDKQNWLKLASYYLKTVVLLNTMNNPSKEYWSSKYAFDRLLDALKQLKIYLDENNLPHFLTGANLILKMQPDNCKDWSCCLKRMISSLESDPRTLYKYFLRESTPALSS